MHIKQKLRIIKEHKEKKIKQYQMQKQNQWCIILKKKIQTEMQKIINAGITELEQ